MNKIYKYTIEDAVERIMIPVGSRILEVHYQGQGFATIWVLINDLATQNQERIFHVIGTGHDISHPDELNYLGTAHDPKGLVWHIFEETISAPTIQDRFYPTGVDHE